MDNCMGRITNILISKQDATILHKLKYLCSPASYRAFGLSKMVMLDYPNFKLNHFLFLRNGMDRPINPFYLVEQRVLRIEPTNGTIKKICSDLFAIFSFQQCQHFYLVEQASIWFTHFGASLEGYVFIGYL